MLELWVSPQILLESEPQLVQVLVFTDPHTELLRDDVCDENDILLLTYYFFLGLQETIHFIID